MSASAPESASASTTDDRLTALSMATPLVCRLFSSSPCQMASLARQPKATAVFFSGCCSAGAIRASHTRFACSSHACARLSLTLSTTLTLTQGGGRASFPARMHLHSMSNERLNQAAANRRRNSKGELESRKWKVFERIGHCHQWLRASFRSACGYDNRGWMFMRRPPVSFTCQAEAGE